MHKLKRGKMQLSNFCVSYPNAASDELVEKMINWFETDTQSKTVKPSRTKSIITIGIFVNFIISKI